MDKHFLFPDSSNLDNKLLRASSFSELSTTTKIKIEKQYKSDLNKNLIKQYSCEEIFENHHKINKRQSAIFQVSKTDNDERKYKWQTMLPMNSSKDFSNSTKDNSEYMTKSFSFPNEKTKTPQKTNLRSILAPAKLTLDGNNLNQTMTNKFKNFSLKNVMSSDNGQDNTFEFENELPLPPIENLNIKNSGVKKEKTSTDETVISESCDSSDQNDFDTTKLNNRLRRLTAVEPKKIKSISFRRSYKFIILIVAISAYLVYYVNTIDFSKKFCSPRFKFDEVPNILRSRVYSQEHAVDELTTYFINKNNKTGFNMLVLVGGVGVGKSYTSELVKDSIKSSINVIDVFPLLFNKEDATFASLSLCRCNLIRLENLKTDDIPDAAIFVERLKRKAAGYCVMVLALFNTQETDEYLKKTLDLRKSISLIQQTFEERKLNATFISYSSISSEALGKCIRDAADYNNVELTNLDVEDIKRDLQTASSGCKGAYAKVQLYRKPERRSSSRAEL